MLLSEKRDVPFSSDCSVVKPTLLVVYQVTAVYPTYLKAYCPTYNELWNCATGPNKLDAYWCYVYGRSTELKENMVLVTPEMCRLHPALISPDEGTRERVLNYYFPELFKTKVKGGKGGKKTGVTAPPAAVNQGG